MIVHIKTYEPTQFNKKEILRYAGVTKATDEFDALLNECINEVRNKLVYKVCCTEFEISVTEKHVDLGFIKIQSNDLFKNLKDCKSIILFGATVGIEIDRLIAKYGVISPAKALMLQAIGSERIESLCDSFNNEIKIHRETVPRFSAGYGDFPIDAQKAIFSVLDCQRKIGLTLNESLLMSPSKSVTAIIGVK